MQLIFQTLLFSATLADYLTANFTCDCSFHAEETECTNTGICFWVNKACQKLDCSDIDEGSCDFQGGCSLNNDNKCENTQACSTYTVEKQTDCMFLKGNCAPQSIENDTTQYQCSTYTMADCSAQDNTTCNYSYKNGSDYCWMNSTAKDGVCQVYDINTCAGVPDQIPCEGLGCVFNNTSNICDFSPCSNIITEPACAFTFDGYWGGLILCKWNGTHCIDRADFKDLTNGNCSKMTGGRHYWINDTCRACPDNIEPGLLFSINLAFFFVLYVCL